MNLWWYPIAYFRGDNSAYGFPANFCATYIYPHSDSTCIGLTTSVFVPQNEDISDYVQNKLKDSLKAEHHYKFSMWVQLADSLQFSWSNMEGKVVGINSFSALFTDSAFSTWQGVNNSTAFPYWNYKPQVQINTMVTDTQHWVLLTDTFIAKGGERYMTLSNFKRNDSIQYQVVINKDSLPAYNYYFIDDVSLIDLDEPNGIAHSPLEKVGMRLFPNPATNELHISIDNTQLIKIEVFDIVGSLKLNPAAIPPFQGGKGDVVLDVSNLPNGIYFLKTTDTKGFQQTAKFVKE